MASIPQSGLPAAKVRRLRPIKYRRQEEQGGLEFKSMPSWLVSLALHVTLLLIAASTIRMPAGFGTPGSGGEHFDGIFADQFGSAAPGLPGDGTGQPAGDAVGIHLGPGESAERDRSDAGDGEERTESQPTATARPSGDSEREADDTPPVDLELPTSYAKVGPGRGMFASARNDAPELIKSTGKSRATGGGDSPGAGSGSGGDGGPRGGGGVAGVGGGAGGNGKGRGGGGTSFFGHQANGTRFVYLLDASASMYDYNAIAVAKAELLSSLQRLDTTQQFEIIFYNDKAHPLVGPDGKSQLFWGTETNRTLASQFIRSIDPEGGTRHLDAVLAALGYGPDVLFFLTDAGEPILYPGDLEKIKKRNNGRSRIFTIEFGKGANLRTDNYLKKLARDNDGSHVYRDVQEFQKK